MKLEINLSVDTTAEQGADDLKQVIAALTAISMGVVEITKNGEENPIKSMEVVSDEVEPTKEEIAAAKKAEAAAKRKEAREKKKAEEAAAKLKEQQSGNDKSAETEENSTSEEKPEETQATSDETETGEVTKTMLQTLIRQKSTENNEIHRPALKKELARLGAKNVSTLAEEHYAEFHEFMSNL